MAGSVLFPHTDAGVAGQAALLATVTGASLLAARNHPELRILAAGLALFVFSLMSLRALH